MVYRYAFEYGADNVTIGGTGPGEGNIIAGHEDAGVMLINGPGIVPIGQIRISGNSIYSNGGGGIDLTPNTWTFGPTPNDPLDADTIGANSLQNFPENLAGTSNGTSIQVTATLHSEPLNDYSIEFFASPECDPTGFGQGQMFLGSVSASTDSAGNASVSATFDVSVPDGWYLTSTAIKEPLGETSEFSECALITGPTYPASFTVSRGRHSSGSESDLQASDNVDLSFHRDSIDVLSRIHVELHSTCSTETPSEISFTLEASVFARSQVIQSIDLFNFATSSWEEVDTRTASRFSDSITTINPTGNLSRFVEPGTRAMRSRCRFESTNPRQNFAANLDMAFWTFAD